MVERDNKWDLARPEDFRPCPMPIGTFERPGPKEVHLWYLHLGELGGSLAHALGGGEEAAEPIVRRGHLRFARRFYLRLLLGGYLHLPGKDVKIFRGKRGKPVLDHSVHDQELHFSMAKSEDRLLLGVTSRGAVGVDLEPETRRAHDPRRVARRYFSEAEGQEISQVADDRLDEAFLRAWACKEAVVKASGEGIANQLCKFTVVTDLDRRPGILDFEDDDASLWALGVVRPDSGFTGAVATREGGMEIKAFRLL